MKRFFMWLCVLFDESLDYVCEGIDRHFHPEDYMDELDDLTNNFE